jgi:hypothetical protein
MPTRPCRFSLGLQDDSVFADFDVDRDGHVFLRRISFDGHGCCTAPDAIRRMPVDESRTLLESVDREAIGDPHVEVILRTYFRENAGLLWEDALSENELL